MAEIVDETTVRVSVEVGVPADRAFQLFTAEIGSWWDQDKHILRAPLAEMVFEPYVGGQIIDRGTDGSECRWARVLAYEPPLRVCFSWDITTDWQIETDPDRCSDIEIEFTPLDQHQTRVTLTHRHLDRHGPGWESMRDAVAGGWNLDSFAAAAGRPAAGLSTVTDETMRERLALAKPYTAVLLRATDKFVRPQVNQLVWEHGRRNMALVEAGLLLIVLPVTDDRPLAGRGVFAGDLDAVTELLDDDPGVRAGIFDYEVHPVRGFPGAALV
jgi:uncharacterized protein YndB with AHSA1/START domain